VPKTSVGPVGQGRYGSADGVHGGQILHYTHW